MGVQGAHRTFSFVFSDVTTDELLSIARYRNRDRNEGKRPANIPVIDIDASWIIRKGSGDQDHRVGYLIRLSTYLVRLGFHVVVVCDGSKRHHSKRATTKRKVDCYRNNVVFQKNRMRLSALTKERKENNSTEEKEELDKQIVELKKKTDRLYNTVGKENISVGDDLYHKLQYKINALTSQDTGDRGGHIEVFQAEFQADSVIASRLNRKESDIGLISDSDMCVLTGEHCLCIKEFKFRDKGYSGSVLDEIEIFAAWETTILKAIDILNLPSDTTRLHISSHPIFNNVDDLRLRSLFAVGLGSDVYVGGIHGITPKFIHDNMNKYKEEEIPVEELYEKFISIFVSKHRLHYNKLYSPKLMNDNESKNYKKFINVLVDCFIYEPGNYISGERTMNQIECNKYIHELYLPVYIHPYLKEFCIRDTNVVVSGSSEIDCCDDLVTCKCLGSDTEHPFFRSETYDCCLICNIDICKTCSFVDIDKKSNKEKKTYCYSCYASESYIDINTSNIAPPSNQELFEYLRSWNIQIHQNWSQDILLDIYEAVNRGEGGLYEETSMISKIKFPLENSAYLQNLDEISDFDISNGGSFLNCNDLKIDDNIEILLIMLELINIEKIQDKTTRKDLQLVYSVFPKILIDFADKSRLHSGYRLIKRGIMHATDPECDDLRNSFGKVVRYNGKIGLYLKHKVHASMKNIMYTVQVCFTKEEIVACCCTCPAGCSKANDSKVLCVHVLPVLYQLTMLLFECLGENLLHELAQLSETYVKEDHTDYININLLKITNHLMDAIQYSDKNNRRSSTDLADILEDYKVGTERRKFGPGRIKDPSKLCPLRLLDLRSTTKKAKDVINQNEKSTSENSQTTINYSEKITANTYNNMRQNIIALHSVLEVDIMDQNLLDNFVGFRLLELRSGLKFTDRVRNTSLYSHWKRCINLADCNVHCKSMHRYDDEILFPVEDDIYGNNNIQVDDEEDEEYENQNNVLDNIDNEIIYDIDDDDSSDKENLPRYIKPIKIKRNVCVCCGTSAVKDSNATFKRIPELIMKKVNKPTDDDKKTWAINRFRRNIFLNRLNVNRKRRNMSDLKFCNKHKIVSETFNIPWMSVKKKHAYNEVTCDLLVVEKQSEKISDDIEVSIEEDSLSVTEIEINNNSKRNRLALQNRNAKKLKKATFQQNQPINLQHITEPLVQAKKRPSVLKCAFPNCSVRYNQENVSMKCIPTFVPESKSCLKKNFDRMRTTILNTHRQECLKRIPLDENNKHTIFRICNVHKLEEISVNVRWYNLKNEEKNVVAKMNVPCIFSNNVPITTHRQSRGVGADREIMSGLMRLAHAAEQLDIDAMCAINVIQTQESMIENDTLVSPIKRAIGRTQSVKKTRLIVTDYPGIRKPNTKERMFRTIIKLSNLSDKIINNNTGFKTKALLLSFIIILCRGDINEMLKTETSIRTWWEEWYIYFCILHCKSMQRWSDAEEYFQTSPKVLRRIFDRKMTINLKARTQWPMFATHSEDLLLRKPGKWEEEYKDKRLVMWDCTDITIIKPMSGEAQRLTWSAYYNHNVGKGGIFIQLCNWLGTSELWSGGISDTQYFLKCEILEKQKQFIEEYDNDFSHVPWSIVVDRGFNVGQQAWEAGNQYVYQPPFSRGGAKPFTSIDVINGASIAKVRSGNERAVRIVKCCGYIKEGLRSNESTTRIADAFLVCAFNANFRYRGVQ